MLKQTTLVLATLALSAAAFAQTSIRQDGPFQIGYAANLNVGTSVVNLSNDGTNGGFVGSIPPSLGNICVNAYVFDPQEEEISCCSCLVTPNALSSYSVNAELTANPLTPATPTSVVIKLLASEPATAGTANAPTLTVCNPAGVLTLDGGPAVTTPALALENGMLAWGTTLEPASTPGTYSPVAVPYLNVETTAPTTVTATTPGELGAIVSVCNFIQSDGSGFGICASCNTGATGGALAGAKN